MQSMTIRTHDESPSLGSASSQRLVEKFIFGDASRFLGRLIHVDPTLTPADEITKAASLLSYPTDTDPRGAYLGSMLALFPGDEGETMEEAKVRLKILADEVTAQLTRLAAGEQLSREELSELDIVVNNAYNVVVRDHHFGAVAVREAVN